MERTSSGDHDSDNEASDRIVEETEEDEENESDDGHENENGKVKFEPKMSQKMKTKKGVSIAEDQRPTSRESNTSDGSFGFEDTHHKKAPKVLFSFIALHCCFFKF